MNNPYLGQPGALSQIRADAERLTASSPSPDDITTFVDHALEWMESHLMDGNSGRAVAGWIRNVMTKPEPAKVEPVKVSEGATKE